MNLYTRARKHIDMSRVKELREENIKKQIIAEVNFKQEIIVAELKRIEAEEAKHIDWRSDLEEGMTTADLGMLNLPAEPDTIQTSIPSTTISSADDDGPPDDNGLVIRNQSFQVVDATKTDTITLTISGSFITKTVDGLELNDKVSIAVHVDGTYVGNYLAGDPSGGGNTGLGNGTHTITIPQRFRKAGVRFDAIQLTAFEGESGTVSITGTGLKRVNPMNVFVSLDNPEANSFIRDGLGNQNLSPAQKKKKLEQMLGASAEYLNKVFGKGIFTGASKISDTQIQQSFADLAKTSDNPADWPSRHDLPTGPQGPSKDIPWVPEVPKAKKNDIKDLKIASADWPSIKSHSTLDDIIKAPLPPGSGFRGKYDQFGREIDPKTGFPLKKVQRNQTPQYAHYEPEGEVIVEKKLKSPKSLLDKIPGYYDGKPAPLGFPIEEPPKMVNGRHPDLVDGKKVSNRYNRLDPISAKSMPKTGNKYIDAKVAKARKKAK